MRNVFILFFVLLFSGVLVSQKKFTRDFYFESGSFVLDSAEQKKALVFAKILNKFDLVKIEMIGYTDSDGSESFNLELSKKRINHLRSYFPEMLPDSLFFLHPQGEENPVFQNIDSTKHKNRRVRMRAFYSGKKKNNIKKKQKKEKPKVKLKSEDLIAGKAIELPAVQFYGGTAQFLPGATKILDEVIPILIKNKELKIEIAGHICCGNQMELSIERAFVVYTYFIEREVPRHMLTYKGYNNTQPKYGNIMDYRNRRVELIVLK